MYEESCPSSAVSWKFNIIAPFFSKTSETLIFLVSLAWIWIDVIYFGTSFIITLPLHILNKNKQLLKSLPLLRILLFLLSVQSHPLVEVLIEREHISFSQF